MKVKCLSVRLQSLVSISDKAYKAVAHDGSEAVIPKSQYYGQDWDVNKSEAHWISAWILERVSIQYSHKKVAWFDSETKLMQNAYKVVKNVPKPIHPRQFDPDESLIRETD